MAAQDFIQQLKQLGYDVDDKGDGKVAFPFKVPIGKFTDTLIVLGFVVPSDFPLTPPSGPHVSPCLVTPDGSSQHPAGGVQNNSPFGAGWQYWSRPCTGWARTARDARAYMAYIRKLFETQ